ncbi:MAG: transglycosylase SLT domain-containing protein [Gemmatimonadota bacterium]
MRYALIFAVFVATAAVPTVLPRSAPSPEPRPDVPASVLEALRHGRYWRASRILDGFLDARGDTAPGQILVAAEAAAGWGDWDTVEGLLADRPWLDERADGRGRRLLGRSRIELGKNEAGSADLAEYVRTTARANARERGLVQIRRGRALAAAGDERAALSAFQESLRYLPQIADWIHMFSASAAAAEGDTALVRQHLEAAGEPLATRRGWETAARALAEAGDTAGAIQWARAAGRRLPGAGERAATWTFAGRLELAAGDTASGRATLLHALSVSPGSAAAVDAARALSDLHTSAVEALRVGRIYYRHGNMERAARGFERYLASGQGSRAERLQIRFELGNALFRGRSYRGAERVLLAVSESASSSHPSMAASAMFTAGRAQYRRGHKQTGIATFLRTAARFPHQAVAARAVFTVADLAHDDANLARARKYYRRTVALAPEIDEAGIARMRLAGIAMMQDDTKAALAVYEGYRSQFPDGRRIDQATYWAGRAYEMLGDTAHAKQRFRQVARHDPVGYYGLAAAARLGDTYPTELGAGPEPDTTLQAALARPLERMDLLSDAGEQDAVDWEIQQVARRLDSNDAALYDLAEALDARGYTTAGINIGWKLRDHTSAWNERLLRIVYPFPYRDIVLAEADERGLDPFLVAGLIRRESGFSAAAMSPAGAMGLMQIMPRTGRVLARAAGIRHFGTAMLDLPEINLHLGMAFLADLIHRYDDKVPAVLAAYNAGPTRLKNWRQLPEFRDMELFTERIPFRETRDYVRYVQENARIYAMLYGTATPAVGEE